MDDDHDYVDILDVLDGKAEADSESDSEGSVNSDNARGEKRKAPHDHDSRTPKRRLTERTEAGEENEFRARASGSKLKLDDLLAPLASQPSALSLEKSIKTLTSSSAKLLAAPLPQRAKERLDREAAYEQTKEEVDKWTATMKRIKEAEHLSFPLQAQPMGRTSNAELAAKFKPTTELESSIDKLLKSAQMRADDTEKTEELKANPKQQTDSQHTNHHRQRDPLRQTDHLQHTSHIQHAYKVKKRTKKNEEEKKKAEEDATMEISTTDVLTLSGEVKGVKAFEQRDLVALAFAGDNVVQDFQDTKRREIAADAPREVDTTLPGWGAWGGSGTRRQPPKSHLIKKVPGIDPKARADYNKPHVIISEKRDKKAAKYLVKDLPYPYTSKAQFERSMDRPLGAEWNTRVGFQRGTLPKVVKKMGTIIDPLEKLA